MTQTSKKETVFAERVLLPDGLAPASLWLEHGRIAAMSRGRVEGARMLPAGSVLAPGFLDAQVNGGGGVLFNDDPTPAAIARIVAAHRAGGTTGLLPTLITDAPGMIARAGDAVLAARDTPGMRGVHFEGPFISPRRPGVHPPEWIRAMTAEDAAGIAAIARRVTTLVTLAPEETPPGEMRVLAAAGAVLAAGHTEACPATIAAAAGLRGFTHLWNAMPPLASRAPGPVGAALASDTLFAGVICDGIHVDALSLGVAFRLLGPDRMFLVTDAMPTAGTTLAGFELAGRRIRRRDGRLETADGTLAGADLTMIEAVRFARTRLGASLEAALRMASETPARFLGLAECGRIAAGARADLVLLGSELGVLATAIGGVWEEEGQGRRPGTPLGAGP